MSCWKKKTYLNPDGGQTTVTIESAGPQSLGSANSARWYNCFFESFGAHSSPQTHEAVCGICEKRLKVDVDKINS